MAQHYWLLQMFRRLRDVMTAWCLWRCRRSISLSRFLSPGRVAKACYRGQQNTKLQKTNPLGELKVKVWTLAIAPLTWVRLVTSSALQSRKWQLIGMSQWCRSALCGHPLFALTDSWTLDAASRHTIAPISHTRPSPRSRSYYSFPVPLRVGGWVGLSTQ